MFIRYIYQLHALPALMLCGAVTALAGYKYCQNVGADTHPQVSKSGHYDQYIAKLLIER